MLVKNQSIDWKLFFYTLGISLFCFHCDDGDQLKRVEGLSTRYTMSFKNINSSCQQDYLSILNSHQGVEVNVGRNRGYIFIRHGEAGESDFWQLKGSLCVDGDGVYRYAWLI